MRSIGVLVNRYPEASLTAIRREIEALSGMGFEVRRFAHRPSVQPLAGEADRLEAAQTEYLALAGRAEIALGLLRALVTRPARFTKALAAAFAIHPAPLDAIRYLTLACTLLWRVGSARIDHLHVHFGLTSAVVAMLTRILGGPAWSIRVHGPEEFEPSNRRRLRILMRSACKTIAISQWAAAAAQEISKPRILDIEVVGMGVDGLFLSPTTTIHPDAPIVCVARLDRRKGHQVLLEALALLKPLLGGTGVELIGDGPCRAGIEAEVARRGLSATVRIRGWLAESEVLSCIDRSRFLVLPSLAEGLPVAIMEAYARARPVIASDVGGNTELVRHLSDGIVVPPNDAASLANAIESYLKLSPDQLLVLGERGRRLVEERFDSRLNARRLAGILTLAAASGS